MQTTERNTPTPAFEIAQSQHDDVAVFECKELPPADPSSSTNKSLELSQEQRIRKVLSDVIIIHPRLGALLNEVHWMVQEPRRQRARGFVICGEPGNGKTTIAKLLKLHYPIDRRDMQAGDDRPCVISIGLAGARTTKSVLTRILDCIGCPYTQGSISYLEQLVHDVLKRMHCRLLVFDEAQDVLQGRQGEQLRVVEVIKHMMNELCLPILLLGTKGAAGAMSIDAHMQARFEDSALPNWRCDAELGDFLKHFEQALGLRKPSNLDELPKMKVLVDSSKGVLDRMLTRLKWAAVNAIIDGTECITLKALKSKPVRPKIEVLSGIAV